MPWVSTDRISSTLDASAASGQRWTEIYRVVFDNRDSSPLDAITAIGIPADYSSHPENLWATLREKNCDYQSLESSGMVRLVTCKYFTKADEEDPNETGDPLSWAAKWSGSFNLGQTDLDVDINDFPILNTAGEPYITTPKKALSSPILQCVKNFASFDLATWWGYTDKINSAAWGAIPPNVAKIQNIQFSEQFHSSNTPYYQTTWSFELNFFKEPKTGTTRGWQPSFLSIGIYEKELGGDTKLVRINDKDGKPYATAQALDANGVSLPIPIAEGFYTNHDIYETLNFGTLPIPAPLLKA